MRSHILIVDDDSTVLEMMQYALEGEGYHVTTSPICPANPGEIEVLRPDLIILDLKMQRRDSSDIFLRRLRLYPPTAAIPVFLCTGLSDEREHEIVGHNKGIPVLHKPFSLDELFQMIQKCLVASPLQA